MMIDRVHKTVRTIANTDGRGNVKRESLDIIIHHSVLELYEDMLFEVNRIVNRQNRGLVNGGLENTTNKIREKIQHYLEEKEVGITDGKLTIPSEVRYFDLIIVDDVFAEMCKDNKEFLTVKSKASLKYPVAIKLSNSVKVAPEEIEQCVITYLRNPIPAKWTYNIVDDVELFNPSKSDFKDIDIHPSQEDNLIIRVLQKIGINLKEQDLQNIYQKEIISEFNKNNTN